MKKIFVTGAAGFIGSHLCESLVRDDYQVIGWDNFSTGQRVFLDSLRNHPHFRLIEGDTLDLDSLAKAVKGCDTVFHLAANADVRFGLNHPAKDLHQNTIATFNVLEAMRQNKIKEIFFTSTASVYGDAAVIPTPEDVPFPIQNSLYAASKLAGEGLIEAYSEGYGIRGVIFRFVSILGERYSHGHVFDFYKQLQDHPAHLKILSDGTQRKSYLYIDDCIGAMMKILKKLEKEGGKKGTTIYNLGSLEYCRVTDSVGWICEYLGLKPRLEFGGGDRGWVGDVPFIFLDIKKLQSEGWSPRVSIKEGVIKTVDWFSKNQWVLKRN